MKLKELRQIYESIGKREGWDFSKINFTREAVPWKYSDIVQNYLRPTSYVIDIGTGGGERFIEFSSFFKKGVGIDFDSDMIEKAKENKHAYLEDKISFLIMSTEKLEFPKNTFDIVLNRHSPLYPKEIIKVLKPAGFFITEQVGPKNTENICNIFGCGVGGEYEIDPEQNIDKIINFFKNNGCKIIDYKEYNVKYWFSDIESLIFWLKGIPIPEDFNIEKYWREVNLIINNYTKSEGIETNEHRILTIIKKI